MSLKVAAFVKSRECLRKPQTSELSPLALSKRSIVYIRWSLKGKTHQTRNHEYTDSKKRDITRGAMISQEH
ncbi:hypothetical protein TNCT_691291 [Trichonephila clavata]|uniref:Uncharacterized protein n=1 Tax=Trichonephila clavata TaxID=2740835 RepID=A0A8X6KB77_TRICU|nr:hypothetical protein TNCT_691291 [Trichonephila clavata]